jgi:hypothetical protein
LLHNPQKSSWETFLCRHFVVTGDEVKTTIAVAHIREYQFREALIWLRKIKDPRQLELHRNPFADLIIDYQDSLFSIDKGNFDKISFISTMATLMDKARNKTATAAELYKLATGYYNMTYYGRAWEVVKFERLSTQGAHEIPDATPFEKEYYNCFTAERYFKNAMQASPDKNFRARCLFMMAKCAQKQVKQRPSPSEDYITSEKNYRDFQNRFMQNKYFPQLSREYGNTDFYKEAFTTCSYLRDFVRKK